MCLVVVAPVWRPIRHSTAAERRPPPERTKKKRRVIAHHYHQPTNQPLSIHRLKLELFREMVICHLYTMNLFSSSSNTRPLVIIFFTTITQRDIVHYSCHTLVVSLSLFLSCQMGKCEPTKIWMNQLFIDAEIFSLIS